MRWDDFLFYYSFLFFFSFFCECENGWNGIIVEKEKEGRDQIQWCCSCHILERMLYSLHLRKLDGGGDTQWKHSEVIGLMRIRAENNGSLQGFLPGAIVGLAGRESSERLQWAGRQRIKIFRLWRNWRWVPPVLLANLLAAGKRETQSVGSERRACSRCSPARMGESIGREYREGYRPRASL